MKKKSIIFVILIVIIISGIIWLIYEKNRDKQNNYELLDFESLETQNVENNSENNVENSVENIEETEIYIHIIWEIRNPGIVKLKEGARIIDAIEKSGGVTEYADLSKVNLAYILSDGQKVRIPGINDNTDNEYITNESGNNVIEGIDTYEKSANKKVNINNATQTELETLDGIGPSIAASIIDYRKKNGKFKSIEELKNVTGIGEAKFEKIKDFVDIN